MAICVEKVSDIGAMDATNSSVTSGKANKRPSPARRLANLMTIVHAPVPIKAQVFLAVVVLGSCLQASGVVPETVFSDKNNPINKYLVKFSWFWTAMWMFVTIAITATLYTAFSWRAILRHLSRIAVGHVVWYCVTTAIEILDNRVGECSMEGISTSKACVRGGYEWVGFDVSGHVFLLSYCVFVITEEAFNIKAEIWQQYDVTLETERKVLSKSGKELKVWLTDVHREASCFVEALELIALLLVLIWSAMLLATSLYFHTFAEKLLGLLISVSVWWVSYRGLFGSSCYSPAHPKDGVLHPARYTTI